MMGRRGHVMKGTNSKEIVPLRLQVAINITISEKTMLLFSTLKSQLNLSQLQYFFV